MLRLKFYITVLILLIGITSLHAQNFVDKEGPDAKFAKFCMEFGNYYDAQKEYEGLLKEDPDNVLYKHNLGRCHLYLNNDKSKAIPFFLWVIEQDIHDLNVWYDLGQAYFETDQLQEAKESFEKYLSLDVEDKHQLSASRMIEMIENAEEAMKSPRNIELVNLGKSINTSYPDFNPFITKNEKMLIFTSQRKMNLGNYRYEDGYYAGDLYLSFYKFEKWKKSKRFTSAINSKGIEIGSSMSADGGKLFIYTMELITRNEQMFLSEKKGKHFRKPIEYFSEVKGVQAAVFSPDKHRIYLVMEASDGIGGLDIYYQERDIYGNWSTPIIDSILSTPYNDHYPSFGPDGTFYYASQGHNSMGGYDIFSAKYNKITKEFSKITNMGYPLNTTRDDMSISFSGTNRYAYISSFREGGFGDLDIYRVIFKDVDPVFTVIKGTILDQDSIPFTEVVQKMNDHIDTLNFPINHKYKDLLLKKKDTVQAMEVLATKIPYENVDVKIVAINEETNEVFGNYIAKNSNANYAVILPPGRWKIVFRREGYQDYFLRNVEIEDRSYRNTEIQKHILLRKK